MWKTGANAIDQARIRKMHADGLAAEEISQALRIEPACVRSIVVGSTVEEVKKRRKPKK